MAKLMLFFIVSLVFSACAVFNSKRSSPRKLEGIWLEKWLGTGTDIDYIDTIKIQRHGKRFLMSCINDSTLFYDSIYLNKNRFKFKMLNLSSPTEPFFVYYSLQWQNHFGYLEGTILNSKNQVDTVRLEKLNLQ